MKFCIKLAGVVIGVEHRYEYVRQLYAAYIVEGQKPAFTVSTTEKEILVELNFSMGLYGKEACPPKEYFESQCLYAKIGAGLARYDGLMMHAAVVAVDGKAYVFTAPSGTGKTTHISLWLNHFETRAQVVNGDKPVLRFIDGVLYACGSPWQGSENWGNNIMCPVMGICFLEQARDNSICPLVKEDVIRRLLPQVYRPRKQEDFDSVWLVLDRLVTTADFYLLKCNRDPEAARLSYLTMRRKIEC